MNIETCWAKPLFEGSAFYEFGCGPGAFVTGPRHRMSTLPRKCPFCGKWLNYTQTAAQLLAMKDADIA